MTIRIETSKRRGIVNKQGTDVSKFERNWDAEISNLFPNATRRTEVSATYNCHGLTFACRRSRIPSSTSVRCILADDQWDEVTITDVKAGDIVVYVSSDGDVNHSGLVVGKHEDLNLPVICSKWGSAGEFVHLLNDCPPIYGPDNKFYRCRL